MASLVAALGPPSNLKASPYEQQNALFVSRRRSKKKNQSFAPGARLFGPAIFEASKLKVLFLGVDEEKHPGKLPRAYTLTHSDITSKLTLAISQTINNSQLQGWYNRLQRDEVVAEWKKVKGKMSLHVHCHISGGHFLLDICARLRFFIFSKELPVVLKAFVHGDGNFLNNHPELQEALVWVYFHSNIPEFNKVECCGPLEEAVAGWRKAGGTRHEIRQETSISNRELPEPCQETSNCCFPPMSLIPWSEKLPLQTENRGTQGQDSLQQQTRRGKHSLLTKLIYVKMNRTNVNSSRIPKIQSIGGVLEFEHTSHDTLFEEI